MATISKVIDRGPAVVLVNAAHITQDRSDMLEFEVLEANAGALKSCIGAKQFLAFNGATFWGELVTLVSCSSTAPGLALLRNEATLRGTIRKFPHEAGSLQ